MRDLKIWLVSLVVSLLCLGEGVLQQSSAQQGTPPALRVNLVFDKLEYTLAADPSEGDPIKFAITVENISDPPAEIITSKGFSKLPFHLMLTFIDPDGKGIVANAAKNTAAPEPPPPLVRLIDGVLVQVEEVEILPGGFVVSVTVPDARDFYTLTKGGRYSVKATIPIATYLTSLTIAGVDYAALDSFTFAGALESNTAHFALIAPAIPGDIDGDADVDNDDINTLLQDLNKPVDQSACGPSCDLDGDGVITALDARQLALLCTRPRCATQ
jgi:hypothetical protein